MRILVDRAESLEEYLQSWMKNMEDVHWFKERRLFDYDQDEMRESISREFDKPETLHFLARSEKNREAIGVLGVKVQGEIAVLGRWEPAVGSKYRDSGVGEALIEEALSWLREKRVSKATAMLKYPFGSPETGRWQMKLYRKTGFKQKGPISVSLLANLESAVTASPEIRDLSLVEGDELTVEAFSNFTLRAYATTNQDKLIHGHDRYVSNRRENVRILESIRRGDMGFSPSEFWRLALFKGKPAAFVICFTPKSNYRPKHGVIAEIGVFPEFRKRGIAFSMLAEMHKCLKKCGCQYSYLGTPETNTAALKLYRKAGYLPVFALVNFEKSL